MTFGVNMMRAQCQSALLRLWQQHRLTIEFHPPYLQMEKLVIDAELEMDRATPAQIEEVFALFNSLAGTNWTVEEVLSKRSINLGSPEREGQVLFIAQRLWWLDFGDVDFPVYATMQDEAERTASILELGREKPRLSLELQERRREHYPPLLIICKFVVTRIRQSDFTQQE